MVDTVYWLPIIGGLAAQAGWLGPKVGGHLAPLLYSSREPSELSQWLFSYDDSTIVVLLLLLLLLLLQVSGSNVSSPSGVLGRASASIMYF